MVNKSHLWIKGELKAAINSHWGRQAEQMNRTADFVIEMGLCLGHDVLFHQKLTKPFTVLLVKDRVHKHNPLAGIEQF